MSNKSRNVDSVQFMANTQKNFKIKIYLKLLATEI